MQEDPERPLRRTSLVDEIASRLEQEILAGTYAPGTALPSERDLARRYAVTRTSLKHALVRLEQLGMIETRHGVGSIVLDVRQSGGADLLPHLVSAEGSTTRQLLAEVLEARTFVAASFARLAAHRRTEKDLDELGELLERLERDEGGVEEAQKLENSFVRTLARAGRNRAFVLLVNSVSAAYMLHASTYRHAFDDREWLVERLRTILDAVRERDEVRARLAAETYFGESAARMLGKRRKAHATEG